MKHQVPVSGGNRSACALGARAVALMVGGLIGMSEVGMGEARGAGASMDGGGAPAARAAGVDGWSDLARFPDQVLKGEAWIRADAFRALRLDRAALDGVLANVPKEVIGRGAAGGIRINLPMPDGTWGAFDVVESPVMAPELQAKFPEIRSYLGQGVTDPAATVRFDVSPIGFRAQILSPNGAVYIDPWTRNDWTHYASYYKRDLPVNGAAFRCHTVDVLGDADGIPNIGVGGGRRDRDGVTARSGTVLRTFRLALAATGEFTAYHGSQANAIAVVNTVANRVSGVYETELSTRLSLVANNNLIVYANSGTDPYTAPGANTTTLNANVTALNGAIGSGNYDVGHVMHRGAANGVAGAIGNVCGTNKAQGVSVYDPPVGDPLAIDYVAHELGHQFGGRHSFNNCGGGPGDSATIAHEPGSGSTIMGYAGICGANNIQSNSDPLFASINVDQMLSYIGGLTCDTETPTGNTVPTVGAGSSFTIPARTAFTLTATGSDPDGDTVTYLWEQRNGGSSVSIPASGPVSDNGANPLFRVFTPTTIPSRTFPRYSTVLAGFSAASYAKGEGIATTSRTMNFRVTARDNRAGGSGLNSADMTVTTVSTTTGFAVTAPNGGENWSGLRTVTWSLGGSNASPVNTTSVNILLSTDGGSTFPITLATGVPNTGTADVVLPNISSPSARVRIEPVGNIYFDVSNANFTVSPVPTEPIVVLSGTPTLSDTTGNGNGNGRAEPGESDIRISLTAQNSGGASATNVTGTLTSLTGTASVVSGAVNFGNLNVGASAAGSSPTVIAISPGHPCGSPVNLRVSFSSTEGSWQSDFSISTGQPGGPGLPQTFNYLGAPVAIPDAPSTVGGSAVVAVSGVTGTISNVQLRIGGATCNSTVGSTTVGIDHTYVGDLQIRLTSPSGTTVLLMDRPPGGGGTNSGNNFCQTLFQDGAASLIQNIATAGAPFTGTFAPANALSAFNGQNPNGTWTLNVLDLAGDDLGSIRAFSVIVTGQSAPTCEPPSAGTLGACCAGATCAQLSSGDCTGPNRQFAGTGVACGAVGTTTPCCAADFNKVGGATVQDIFDFLSAYFNGDPEADINGGGLSVQDVFDFLGAYFSGC